MAINKSSIDQEAVEKAIASALEDFYNSLLKKIDEINITDLMTRKNPYLYRAKAIQSAAEIVESVLSATVSSSEETIFGTCFFEPLAIAVSGGDKSLAEGIDVIVSDKENNTIYAIAVKSGTKVFNADSKKKQEENFNAAAKLAKQAKASYQPIIGYSYGKKRTTGRGKPKIYREIAGQDFWQELTGDPEFYLKIIKYMGKQPELYLEKYRESYNKASNRLVKQFTEVFCDDDGCICWEKLVRFNSGYDEPRKTNVDHKNGVFFFTFE
ncbi:MAG: cytoplasmic protein [Clostridia bacterium]|nr:cytoplasmic protein [Clostridia bacterium]